MLYKEKLFIEIRLLLICCTWSWKGFIQFIMKSYIEQLTNSTDRDQTVQMQNVGSIVDELPLNWLYEVPHT